MSTTPLSPCWKPAARNVNAVMTATYWEIGRRIVESEQAGESRANYGEQLLKRLAEDLTSRQSHHFQKLRLSNGPSHCKEKAQPNNAS
jgi:DUF1016 N-terminal domain